MDHATLARLSEALEKLRIEYGSARTIVRDMRAREASNTEQAYWIGVAQTLSGAVANELQALHDAIDRLEISIRPGRN